MRGPSGAPRDRRVLLIVGALVVGLLAMKIQSGLLTASGWSFVAGILLFSGSLYAMAPTGITRLGAITPIGGLLFIAGWTLLAAAAWKGLGS